MKALLLIFTGALASGTVLQIAVLWEIGTIFKTGHDWIPGFVLSWEFVRFGIPFGVVGGATVAIIVLIEILVEKITQDELKRRKNTAQQ
ncbi:hypothetical protein AUJ77_02745 [Candidatus Nomurabacteria bacterium CG1_02_43_90]|uniref:Uncharacterized protein n=1 Tax=Candidatus Nomurabacteria bacterium CG1_02_43_90 TaxID=1805281 RepID=A0A1J4V7E9_9BACT|nr:MAG: hypothetical protein AUJ77_02745 [Candidatus Nomurabacteria bacterium CG1_02_43_90]